MRRADGHPAVEIAIYPDVVWVAARSLIPVPGKTVRHRPARSRHGRTSDRFTTEDVPLGDVVIPAGEWVFPTVSSAGAGSRPGSQARTWRPVSLMTGLEALPVRRG